MSEIERDPVEPLLPLPLPIFHMLLALTEGDRHGYALKREILQRTGGKMNLVRACSTAPSTKCWSKA